MNSRVNVTRRKVLGAVGATALGAAIPVRRARAQQNVVKIGMAARPRLLISDEAMAGLSGSEVDEVLKILFSLNAEGITIIMGQASEKMREGYSFAARAAEDTTRLASQVANERKEHRKSA